MCRAGGGFQRPGRDYSPRKRRGTVVGGPCLRSSVSQIDEAHGRAYVGRPRRAIQNPCESDVLDREPGRIEQRDRFVVADQGLGAEDQLSEGREDVLRSVLSLGYRYVQFAGMGGLMEFTYADTSADGPSPKTGTPYSTPYGVLKLARPLTESHGYAAESLMQGSSIGSAHAR